MKRKLFAYGLAMALTLSSVASVWATDTGVAEGTTESTVLGTRQTVTGGTGGGDSTVTDVVKVTLPSTNGDADFVIDPKGFYGAKKAVKLEEEKITGADKDTVIADGATGVTNPKVTWADLKGVKLSDISGTNKLGANTLVSGEDAVIKAAIKAMGNFDPASDGNHIFGLVDQTALDKFKGKVVGKKAMNVKNEGTDDITVSAAFIPKAVYADEMDKAQFASSDTGLDAAPTDADGKHSLYLTASINDKLVYSGLKISSIQGIESPVYYSPDFATGKPGAGKTDTADAGKEVIRGEADGKFVKFKEAHATAFDEKGQTIKVKLDGDPTYSLPNTSANIVAPGKLTTENYKEKTWDATANSGAGGAAAAAVVANTKDEGVAEPCATAFYIGGKANTKADWSVYSGDNPTASITMNVVYSFDKWKTTETVQAADTTNGFISAAVSAKATVYPAKAKYKGDDPDVERATGEDVVFKIKNNESIAKMFAYKPDDRERTESAGTLVFGGVDLGASVDYSSYYSLNADGTEITIFAKGFKEGLFQTNGTADTYELKVKVGTEFDKAEVTNNTVVRKFEK